MNISITSSTIPNTYYVKYTFSVQVKELNKLICYNLSQPQCISLAVYYIQTSGTLPVTISCSDFSIQEKIGNDYNVEFISSTRETNSSGG